MRKVEACRSVESLWRYYPRTISLLKAKSNLKKKTRCPISGLPYDVALSCLARVRRCDYPSLSLVSKSYRSLVASPELHKMRWQLGITDTEVYVCLRTPPDPNPAWYILRRSSSLIPIASNFPSPHLESSVVALGSAVYVIGGMLQGIPTRHVWRLDCRTHTWHRVPSMGVARASAAAAVLDGKIYVVGGCLLPGARLCTSAGAHNMLLFWDDMVGNIQKVWCAEVSLERRGGEIWGIVEWSHPVMRVGDDDPFARPRRCKVLHSVSVTL